MLSLLLLLAARDTKEDDDDDDDENDEAGPNRTAECREGVTKAAVGSTAELTDQRHQTTANSGSVGGVNQHPDRRTIGIPLLLMEKDIIGVHTPDDY